MITFDHVTYTYEGRTEPSLRGCSFTVGPGELILFTRRERVRQDHHHQAHQRAAPAWRRRDFGRRRHSRRPGCGRDAPVGAGANRGLRVSESQSLSSSIWTPPARCSLAWRAGGASREEMSRALASAAQVCGVGPLLDRNSFALSGGGEAAHRLCQRMGHGTGGVCVG